MTRPHRAALQAALVISLAGSALAAGDPPSSEADRTAARELMSEGNDLYTKGQLAAAYRKYRDAWDKARSFDIACNVGGTASELALYREAAEFLEYCLRHYAASSRPEAVAAEERARTAFEALKKKVGQVTLRVTPPGAEVFVNGKRHGIAPLPAPVFLEPGQPNRIEARHAGYESFETELSAEAGEALELPIELERPPPAPATTDPVRDERTPSAPTAREHPKLVFVLSGAGLAAVGLGVGIGFTLNAASIGDDRRQAIADLGSDDPRSACSGEAGSTPECREISNLNDDEKSARALGITGFVVGGLATAGTLVYALWPRDPASAAMTPARIATRPQQGMRLERVAADPTPGGAMLALSGRF